MITFPLAARNAFNLGVDGAALEGVGAAGNLVETQLARAPEIQRVSTSAGSEVYGTFTLAFNNGTTEELVYNATAEEVRSSARYSCRFDVCARNGWTRRGPTLFELVLHAGRVDLARQTIGTMLQLAET